MKRIAILLLVAVLIAGALTGIMATQGLSVPSYIGALSAKIDTLVGNVDGIDQKVDNIDTALADVPKMWGYSGNFTVIDTTCRTDPYVSPSPQEPVGPKHVVMTIDFSGIVDGSSQGILVGATIGNSNTPVTIWSYIGFVPSEPHFITLDFVANDWDIMAFHCGGADFTIYYSVNVTGI